MSTTSGPSSSGKVSSSRLRGYASTGYLPLRVQVKTPKTIIRPTVGLRVSNEDSMRSILQRALAFNDRFLKSEEDILNFLSQPVDIVVSNVRTENTDSAVRVQLNTTVSEALMYEDVDRVLFEIIPSVSRTNSGLPALTACSLLGAYPCC